MAVSILFVLSNLYKERLLQEGYKNLLKPTKTYIYIYIANTHTYIYICVKKIVPPARRRRPPRRRPPPPGRRDLI